MPLEAPGGGSSSDLGNRVGIREGFLMLTLSPEGQGEYARSRGKAPPPSPLPAERRPSEKTQG